MTASLSPNKQANMTVTSFKRSAHRVALLHKHSIDSLQSFVTCHMHNRLQSSKESSLHLSMTAHVVELLHCFIHKLTAQSASKALSSSEIFLCKLFSDSLCLNLEGCGSTAVKQRSHQQHMITNGAH
jgi:hypothetical protein